MAHDRYGRRLTSRGGSPTSLTSGDEMMRIPTRSLTGPTPVVDSRQQQRAPRSRTGPQNGGGPRLPRNRMGSLATIDNTKMPFRTNSAATLQYVPKLSPPSETRVPPVVNTINNAGLGMESQFNTKPIQRNSIPGYRARCIEDSDDDIQTDYYSESSSIKMTTLNPELSSYITQPSSQTMKHDISLTLSSNITLQKQDSGIDQQMDTLQSPTSPDNALITDQLSYDPETYQKHLDDIKRKATEWSRLQEGLALLLPNTDGDTGFHHAVIHMKPNVLLRLLELVGRYPHLNSCINDQNSLYQTCLHLAIHLQQLDMIRMLLNAGASLHLQDHKGNTPLHIACQQKNTLCLDQLLSNVRPRTLSELSEIRNYDGNSCVHIAAYAENTEALLKLRGAGINIDMKSSGSGKTALHIAIERGSFQMTQILIQSCGADFNRAMYSGCTPLHIAAGWDNMEIVAYLISLGADPYAVTDEGDLAVDLVSNEGVRQFLSAVTGIC